MLHRIDELCRCLSSLQGAAAEWTGLLCQLKKKKDGRKCFILEQMKEMVLRDIISGLQRSGYKGLWNETSHIGDAPNPSSHRRNLQRKFSRNLRQYGWMPTASMWAEACLSSSFFVATYNVICQQSSTLKMNTPSISD